jgi:hypothetical protein
MILICWCNDVVSYSYIHHLSTYAIHRKKQLVCDLSLLPIQFYEGKHEAKEVSGVMKIYSARIFMVFII